MTGFRNCSLIPIMQYSLTSFLSQDSCVNNPLVCQSVSLTKYHFFCLPKLETSDLWDVLVISEWQFFYSLKTCCLPQMSWPRNKHARCQVHVSKTCFTSVYIFQSSEPPRHYWPPPKLAPWPMWNTILLNMIWFFLKPCWSSPQPKASQASLATLEGSRKSCRRFHETCDLSQFLIRRPKSINKSIEHGDFQQCHPTSSFKALCSR